MRDPNRIPRILEQLRVAWEQSPDLRLTQLVVGVVRPRDACPEVFHCEDDRFEVALAAWIARLDQ